MNDVKKFVSQWRGRGYEKGESHSFWLSFLRDVLGISEPEKFIRFEVPVKLKHTSFIDAFLPDTKVIIEQKSLSESLTQEKSQSDGSTLTPYEQAQRYGSSLPYSMRPRWIVVCNFREFLIYDMETLVTPTKILLTKLPDKFHAFDFLIDETKNKLRIELEFRQDLILLFDVLNTPIDARDPYLDDTLKKFPYVNGGLFNGAIEIPNFTPEIKTLLLDEASSTFNWSGISPTIFGAVFESTLNPQTRRADTPTLFAEDRFVDAPAIIIPMLSSCNRKYVPIGFVDAGVIVNIQASFIPNGDFYTFGVLTSSIMMIWLKTVGGQFKSDYRFSATTVYNTFPWCEPTKSARRAIEQSAQAILDVRAKYPDTKLADLYDELSMPKDLRDAHRKNDLAVTKAYGWEKFWDDEPKITVELLKLYERLTNK